MPKDYRFEFLKMLVESETGTVDFRPIVMPLIESGELTRVGVNKLFNDMKKEGFARPGSDWGSLTVSQGGVYYGDALPLTVILEYKGRDKYYDLLKQYSPEMPNNSINVGGNFTGNISQGNTAPTTQTINEENPESTDLARKSLKVGRGTLIWTIIAAAIATLGILLAALFSK